jgi:hypothetical protein
MKKFLSFLSVAALTTLISSYSSAEDKPKAIAAKKPEVKAVDEKKTAVKPVENKAAEKQEMVEEIITFSPSDYFYHSRAFYEKQDMKAAAHELEKAASMLEITAGWDKSKITKERLTESAKDLRKVAASLEKGDATPSLKKLEEVIARAHMSLSWHHFHAMGSTLNDLEGREANVAGHHLIIAGRYMAAAAKWAGRPLGTETVETVRSLDELGDKLITVHEYEIAKPEPSIEKFEKELEKLGQEIEDGAKLTAR